MRAFDAMTVSPGTDSKRDDLDICSGSGKIGNRPKAAASGEEPVTVTGQTEASLPEHKAARYAKRAAAKTAALSPGRVCRYSVQTLVVFMPVSASVLVL